MRSKLPALQLSCILLLSSFSLFSQAPTASLSLSSGTVCAKETVQVTDLSSDSPTAWSYSVNGVATSTVQNPDLVFPAAGTYTIDLEATNANGTSAVATETLFVNGLPTLSVMGSTQVCTFATSTLSASGADTYSWSTGFTGSMTTIAPSATMVYTLVGTSAQTGCSDSSFIAVSAIPLPTIAASDATICSGNSHTITVTGASTYTFSSGSNIVSPLSNASYTIEGTDIATGCSNATIISVQVTSVSITAAGGTLCAGQAFTIVPSGATNYTYSGGSAIVFPTTNTTYVVTGDDALTGCSGTVAVSIAVTAAPNIIANSATICAGQVFTITPGGAANYTISGGSATVAPQTTTTYVVGGTSPATGCPGFKTLTLTVNPLPVVSVSGGTLCAGDVFTLIPTGAVSYTISGDTSVVAPTVTTTYSITGESAQGCISQQALATITIAGIKPNVFLSPLTPTSICQGESVTLSAFGAVSYSWNTGATTSSIVVSPNLTTLYTVIGTDVLTGCSTTVNFLETVDICTGIAQVDDDAQINIYPNPFNSEITINVLAETHMHLVTVTGKVLLSQSLPAGQNRIDLGAQPAGIYFLQIQQSAGVKNIRIIKN